MSGAIPSPGIFSASAFNALIAIRRYMNEHQVDASEACSSLVSLSPDFASSNRTKALSLHARLPIGLAFVDAVADRQLCLEILIEEERPWWRKLFPSGRGIVRTALTDDEQQVFADAGLFDMPPSGSTLGWWYRIQAIVRAEQDTTQSVQGGDAELRTLAFERDRLAKLGLALEPELVGFENNGLGYDVKSYDPGEAEPVARLIEVKSSTSSPPRMFIPRREWDAALQYGASFFFYLWHGKQAEKLTILTAEQVAAHMPADQGDGEWQDVEVTFASLKD